MFFQTPAAASVASTFCWTAMLFQAVIPRARTMSAHVGRVQMVGRDAVSHSCPVYAVLAW